MLSYYFYDASREHAENMYQQSDRSVPQGADQP